MGNIHGQDKMAPVARVGHYNDPDMLEIGNPGLTPTEYRSHMSLWCLAAAPLLAGCNIISASNETLEILTNKEAIAVNQDPGLNGAVQGTLLSASNDGTTEVWRKIMSDGSVAVVLLNL